MATATVGELIKEARTKKGLSQAALAEMIEGLSATDISKAERGEKELTQAQLKAIAKATGVTQKSLLEAPTGTKKTSSTSSSSKKTSSSGSAKKTSSASSSSSKKTSSASSSSKKTSSTSSSSKKTSSKKEEDYTLTNAEKSLIKAYRAADSDTRKNALAVLKGEKPTSEDMLSSILNAGMDLLGGKK